MSRTRTRTSSFTPTETKVVTSKAKRMAGVANVPETFAERRANRKNKTAYNSELAQTVVTETAVKGGAASIVKSTKDVVSVYGEAGKQFAKLALADKIVAELVAFIPESKSKAFFKKVPFLGTYITNREEAAIKGALVTIAPVVFTHLSMTVDSDKLAFAFNEVSKTLIDMGARDGIEASTNLLSPRLSSLWEKVVAFTAEPETETE